MLQRIVEGPGCRMEGCRNESAFRMQGLCGERSDLCQRDELGADELPPEPRGPIVGVGLHPLELVDQRVIPADQRLKKTHDSPMISTERRRNRENKRPIDGQESGLN